MILRIIFVVFMSLDSSCGDVIGFFELFGWDEKKQCVDSQIIVSRNDSRMPLTSLNSNFKSIIMKDEKNAFFWVVEDDWLNLCYSTVEGNVVNVYRLDNFDVKELTQIINSDLNKDELKRALLSFKNNDNKTLLNSSLQKSQF